VRKAEAFVLDFFESFLDPLEAEFAAKSTHTIGRSTARGREGLHPPHRRDQFRPRHDDGASSKDLDKADVILVGVSRSGKTPPASTFPSNSESARRIARSFPRISTG